MSAIIYDLEGIIINTEWIWDKSHEVFMNGLNIIDNESDLKGQITGKTIEEGTALIKSKYSIDIPIPELIQKRKIAFKKVAKNNKISFINGFNEFHNKIKKLKLKSCVATSMDKELFDFLNTSEKLYKMFENKIFFVEIENLYSKPNPDIFLFSAKSIGSDPKNCVVIEDSPNGIQAANRAKMKCIALSHTFNRNLLENADYIYDSFNEIDIVNILNNHL